ncbi:hypothetical protein SDC9_178983 [bioreactor metagenome]|uniref:Uncharacterized protein n=1 Tax=bioreactor metagenome TaxID=1076179 RepID=A0A645H0K0_9ZZZZ
MEIGEDLLDGDGENGAHGRIQSFAGFSDGCRLAPEDEDAFQHRSFQGGGRSLTATLGRRALRAQILCDITIRDGFVGIFPRLLRAYDFVKKFFHVVVVFHQENHGVLQLHLRIRGDQEFIPLVVPDGRVDEFQTQLDIFGAAYDRRPAEFDR